MDWSMGDFVIAGGLLLVLAGAAGLIFAGRLRLSYRVGWAIGLVTAVFLVWVTGAVGLIGASTNNANLAYSGLVSLGGLGALAVRFRARGMSLVSIAMALGQAGIGVTALLAGWGREGASWPFDIIAATVTFGLLWLAAALCFRRAAKTV